MDRDWNANPTYESGRVRVDSNLSPAVVYGMTPPRHVEALFNHVVR